MKRLMTLLLAVVAVTYAGIAREVSRFDDGWLFAFGNASDPAKDFGCGTEYFNYLTKVASIHNAGPYSPKFDQSAWPAEWKSVTLPHDWVVDLPYAPEASHSHGYKTVGYKYPETSVGWYRKTFTIPAEDYGRHISLRFDGIFRDARVWVNGFYLGGSECGYIPQNFDISEYLDYGGENVVAVRVDATLEEGWFYEGAGIYRHVWLEKSAPIHIATYGIAVTPELNETFDKADVRVVADVDNKGLAAGDYSLRMTVYAPDGNLVATKEQPSRHVGAKNCDTSALTFGIDNPKLWSPETPVLYTLRTEVIAGGAVVDENSTRFGVRSAVFDADRGFVLNGTPYKLKGVNMHQDHAGVGSSIPDALQAYRLRELKKIGVNAYRSSHNPMTPEMLDACDSIGILVLEESRLPGINPEQLEPLQLMIKRDRNHPSIILWSVGNEEWGIEWNVWGERLAASLREYCHIYDPSRPMCMATSGGPTVVVPVDVAGYNYIMQNPVDKHRADYPGRKAVGSEETTGCGTRGIYFEDRENGRMVAHNRYKNGADSVYNCIERGWKFYDERPWLGGLFYWTGFDYRGEPNPLKYPATGSSFGILDYCGFPKDEAFYLKAWWTDEPVLHLLPHWNLQGHEGETVSVWAYSNMDEVELFVNGKTAGRKAMPHNGHLEWNVTYAPGTLKAVGYKNGKKTLTETVVTASAPVSLVLDVDRKEIDADGRDVAVVNVTVVDKKGNFVPDACLDLHLAIDGDARILGVGNGDSAFRSDERPSDPDARSYHVTTFNGHAQVLVQSKAAETDSDVTLSISADGIRTASAQIRCVLP